MRRFGALVAAILVLFTFNHAVAGAAAESNDILIEAGDVTLGATLYWPSSCPEDGCSALVLGHGSAPTTRDDLGFYKNIGLSLGFAVLAYDKRGNGVSTGMFEPFCVENSERIFNTLASDMVAATRWLSKQQGINAKDIGLLGGSQAGWIMPLAVSKGAPASFVIIGEGVPVSAGQENVHGQTLVRLRGAEAAETITFKDLHSADLAVEAYDQNHGFDPRPHLSQYTTPTLWFFGLRDYVIPVLPSLRVLEQEIKNGKSNHAIHVFPFGDHNFTNHATSKRYDLKPIIATWHAGLKNSSKN